MLKRSVRPLGRPLAPALAALAIAAGAGTAAAQTATVRVARENFRAAPSGVILAEVMADTELPLGERQDRWRQATLEGWVWGASVREEAQDGHDLVISAADGENLRSVPNGPILARLREGMRLDRVETRGRWVLVRRSGWVWEPSLEVLESEATPPPVPPGTPRATSGGARVTDAGRGGMPSAGAPEGESGRREFTISGRNGSTLLENPTGDTLARIVPGASVQVLAREGAWARVRVEGWTSAASLAGSDTAAAAVLRDVSTARLAENPEAYRGRILEWGIQFIAFQEAERFRTDFIEGEPFILARGPGEEAGFVYVAVPPDRVEEVRRLLPLQRLRILGRVRSARSPLTGAPVIDLLEIRSVRDR